MFSIDILKQKLSTLTAKSKFLVAYSGGMDSHVLLYALSRLRDADNEIKLRAMYIHHGISINADSWEQHCRQVCKQLDIEFLTEKIELKSNLTKKHGLEAVARELRYHALAQTLAVDECLVAAHHADDQAETLLLQLFRGSGPNGLAAMPEKKYFSQGELIRPLLGFSRIELQRYALDCNLSWIEDESNENTGYGRNYIRYKLMPEIKHNWPGISGTLGRVANHFAETKELLEFVARQDYKNCFCAKKQTLSIEQLLLLSEVRQKNLIRYWLHELHLPIPSTVKLQHILSDILHCRADAEPCVAWNGAEIRRYRDDLYAMSPLLDHDASMIIRWDGKTSLQLPNNLGVISPKILQEANLKIDDLAAITIRFRQGGERIKLIGRKHSSDLTKVLQEKNVPPWLRGRVPLIYVDSELRLLIID